MDSTSKTHAPPFGQTPRGHGSERDALIRLGKQTLPMPASIPSSVCVATQPPKAVMVVSWV